jgi:hypothetical protein
LGDGQRLHAMDVTTTRGFQCVSREYAVATHSHRDRVVYTTRTP